jgi:hypothetical protein
MVFFLVFQHKVLVHTTLIRDGAGLGFSIAGGKGSPPYRDDSDAIYISRISPQGAAAKDGKMMVGDKVVSVSIVKQAIYRPFYSNNAYLCLRCRWNVNLNYEVNY